MANTQNILINFARGMETKTDPWQLQLGQFQNLTNTIFQTPMMMRKRDGYGNVLGVPPPSAYLTTLNGNLLAIGNTINAYSKTSKKKFITKGEIQPCSLNVMPLIRNNVNQIQVDAVSSHGMVCIVYTTQYGTSTGTVTQYLYAIEDEVTGQNIVAPTPIPPLPTGAISGSSRVFVVGNFFVIVSPVTITGTTFLQYVAIALIDPTIVQPPQNTFPEAYVALSSNPGWDAVVSNNTLVLAYNTTAGGQGVHVTSLDQTQIADNTSSGLVHPFTGAGFVAGILSMCVDLSVFPNVIYISFWNPTSQNLYTAAVTIGFGSITTKFVPTIITGGFVVLNIASAAQNNLCTVYFEQFHVYTFDFTTVSNEIAANTITSTAVVGTVYHVIRSLGLASKAFIIDGIEYVLGAFSSPLQPSYFLINGTKSRQESPVIVAKLAYQNGGGYLKLGLPSVTVTDNIAQIAYLFKQEVEALNTLNNTQQTSVGGVYSQLGANYVSIVIGTQSIDSAEIANNLHLSGGYLSMFDGFYPVEHNFFVFPEPVVLGYAEVSTVTPTGSWSSGSSVITVSSATGISPGMTIIDTTNPTFIPAGTQVLYVSGVTVTLSKATVGAGVGDALSIQGNIAAKPDGATNINAYFYSVTYEWTDMEGNAFKSQPSIPVSISTTGSGSTGVISISLPTLRLTQKVVNPVKIVIYRWSVANQAYFQVTSIFSPLLNNPTIDNVGFIDTLSDAQIIGNNLLYTTGGVVPDTNAPASNILTLFDTRLFLVDAEDPNLLWLSKTVIEGTPVEMSSLFTIFVAPNVGTTSTTGPITAMSPMDDKLILFKKNAIFYISGTGPDNLGTTSPGSPLGNYTQPIFITSVVGSVNQKSVVLTPEGLMFQSDKGIWVIRRNLETSYIGSPVEIFNHSLVNSAKVVAGTNFVLFTLNTGEMIMYDYYMGQWGTFEGAPAISSCIFDNLHTILTPFGQIWQQTPGQYLDGSTPVLMSFLSSWINLAGLQGYERFYEFYLKARYLSPHTLNVDVAYNYNDSFLHQSIIHPLNFSPSTPGPFGVITPFGSPRDLEQWRIHAKQQLCESFKIKVSEVFDPSFGTVAGAGLTISGINCKVLLKKALRPIRGAHAVG